MRSVDAASARRAASADAGFTMAEMMVALGVVVVVMAALGPFLVNSLALVHYHRGRQVAMQLSGDAVERARALHGAALLTGRGSGSSTAQWNTAPAAVAAHLTTMKLAWDTDPFIPASAGESAALPTTPRVITVDKVAYSQHWYVGRCRQQGGATGAADRPCENPDTADPDPSRQDVPLFRLVVAVTWTHRACPNSSCIFVTSTLFSNAEDPVFDLNRVGP